MYKLLITTIPAYSRNSSHASIHTVIAEFEKQTQADEAYDKIPWNNDDVIYQVVKLY